MNWLINLLLYRGNDLSTDHLPDAYFFKQSILKYHQIPLWNPIHYGGAPYLADPQNFIFYLPNYLFLLLPIETAFIVLLVAHLVWAAMGTYKLARAHFSLNAWLSVSCSLFFVFTPKMFAHLEAGHYPMLIAFSWLPWFFLAAFKFIKNPSLKLTGYLSLIAWILYINYINIAYFALLFFYAFTLFKLITRSFHLKSFLIHNSLFIILFLGLISPSLLAQLEFAPLSNRSSLTFAEVAQPVWPLKTFFLDLFFPFFLSPADHSTEKVLFPGIVTWGLALFGFTTRKNPDRWFYLTWLIFSGLFALGSAIPFFIFFYKFMPLMRWLRITTRLWIITNLFLAAFASLGVQHLWSKKRFYLASILLFLGLLELGYINHKLFAIPTFKDDVPSSFYQQIITDKDQPFRVYCPVDCLSLQTLGQAQIATLNGNNPVRLSSATRLLESASGYQLGKYLPIVPAYAALGQKPQPDAITLGRLNTKYVISPYQLSDENFKLLNQIDGFFLYENARRRIFSLTDDQAEFIVHSPNKLVVAVNSKAEAKLILSEFSYPGWTAQDQVGNLLHFDPSTALRAVAINLETTEVTITYWPRSLNFTLLLFALTLGVCLHSTGLYRTRVNSPTTLSKWVRQNRFLKPKSPS